MLADTRFRVSRRQGVQLLQRRAEHGGREVTTHRLTLASGGSPHFMFAGEETIVVLQEGTGTWISGAQSWPVARSSVFVEKATALFLPPGHQLRVEAATPLEAVLISTPASEGVAAVLCAPSDVTVATRGRDSY